MKRLRVLATVFIVVVAAFGIWVASTGMRRGATEGARSDTAGTAYDYVVRDVVVQQMGPDGTLQYEMSAKQINQQPKNGQITAMEPVIHRDPPGSPPGGPNRWTLRANQAELPQPGGAITLRGSVHAQGRMENTPVTVVTEELVYNLGAQEVLIDREVDFTWGSSKSRCDDLRMNIKDGTVVVESGCNGTYAP